MPGLSKKTALSDALAKAAHGAGSPKLPAATEVTMRAGARSAGTNPNRVGRVNVAWYFDPAVKQSLPLIQAKHPCRTVQDLLAEALNDLFSKYNVPQTANIQK
jgi:hypothetical protein